VDYQANFPLRAKADLHPEQLTLVLTSVLRRGMLHAD
jgi:hypothetical protein